MFEPTKICARLGDAKTERQPYEKNWQELAEVMRPLREEFGHMLQPGSRRGREILDATGIQAVDHLSSGIFNMASNPAVRWAEYADEDDDLMKFQPVKDWYARATKTAHKTLGPGFSKFYNNVPQLYADKATFGTGIFYSAELIGQRRFIDTARPLREIYLVMNNEEDYETVYRVFEMTVTMLVEEFGDQVPKKIRDEEEKQPNKKYEVCHVAYRNKDLKRGRAGPEGKPVISHYVLVETKSTLKVAGWFDHPFDVDIWSRAAGEIYGRGPGDMALPDVQMLQAMEKTNIETAQRIAKPSYLAGDEDDYDVIRTNIPGGVTYGAMTNGRPNITPLNTGANVPMALQMTEQKRNQIREAFFFSLLSFVDVPSKTATEIMTLNEEKLTRMAPHLSNNQTMFLSPFFMRRFSMLQRAGAFPEPPEELRGRKISVNFVSPFARAQQASEGAATMRFLEAALPVMQLKPEVADRLDADATLDVLQTTIGAPAHLLIDVRKVREQRQANQQAAQADQALEMAQKGANVAQTASQAVATGGDGT